MKTFSISHSHFQDDDHLSGHLKGVHTLQEFRMVQLVHDGDLLSHRRHFLRRGFDELCRQSFSRRFAQTPVDYSKAPSVCE